MVLDKDILEKISSTMDRYAALWDFIVEFIDFHPDAIALLDGDFNFVKVNQKAANYLNLDISEVEGQPIVDLIPDVESSGRLDMYRKVFETGEALTLTGFSDKELYGDATLVIRVLKINGGVAIVGTNMAEIDRRQIPR